MEITLKRNNEHVHFTGTNSDGNSVQIDGSAQIGGEEKGMRPMELLLTSVAACSAFDVVSILKKQRQSLEDVLVKAKADRASEGDVKPFTAIHLTFEIIGEVHQEKAKRAVQLAVEKYCSVGASLNPDIPVTHETVFPVR
ncbi:MAG: OsmC family protein [Balneolales bacterium]|nr:OsmC family protein [Balneolales bacterium]